MKKLRLKKSIKNKMYEYSIILIACTVVVVGILSLAKRIETLEQNKKMTETSIVYQSK